MILTIALYQVPIEYTTLGVVRRLSINLPDWGDLKGVCYDEGKLYVLFFNRQSGAYTLHVTDVNGNILATKPLEGHAYHVCVDPRNHRIYIPMGRSGVFVVYWNGKDLATEKILTCVSSAVSVALASSDTMYVCDVFKKAVYLVDISLDIIVDALPAPDARPHVGIPFNVAVVRDTVLVHYAGDVLVLYEHGISSTGKILTILTGSEEHNIRVINTDAFHFLLPLEGNIIIIDMKGRIQQRVYMYQFQQYASHCVVTEQQLWAFCWMYKHPELTRQYIGTVLEQ